MAIYTIDEGSTEIVIQLPSNFPLGPVSVDSSKRVGVTAAQWRTWILQLTTFLQVCMAKVLETKCNQLLSCLPPPTFSFLITAEVVNDDVVNGTKNSNLLDCQYFVNHQNVIQIFLPLFTTSTEAYQ